MTPTNTATKASIFASLGEELKSRLLLIFIFVLSSRLGDIISQPITDGVMYFIVASLLEVSIIIVTFRMFGDKSICRDINELNFYALLAHLIAIPFYLNSVPSKYHNWALDGVVYLGVARMLYFGPRTQDGDFKGLPNFGLLSFLRQKYVYWQLNHLRSNLNIIPTICFFASAIPLWLITFRTNDPSISVSVCVAMIFVFMLANAQTHGKKLNGAANAQMAALSRDEVIDILNQQALTEREMASALTPRNVALQLMDAYVKTHPVIRNISLAIMIRGARTHADKLTSKTIRAMQLEMTICLGTLQEIGNEQKRRMQNLEIRQQDLARLHLALQSEEMIKLDADGRCAFMDYVMQFSAKTLPDTTFVLALDMLITAWLHLILDVNGEYMADFDNIERMSKQFYVKFGMGEYDAMRM